MSSRRPIYLYRMKCFENGKKKFAIQKFQVLFSKRAYVFRFESYLSEFCGNQIFVPFNLNGSGTKQPILNGTKQPISKEYKIADW